MALRNLEAWFKALSLGDRLDLTLCCRWYAYHLDGYLNSIYRQLLYPLGRLLRHMENIGDADAHWAWTQEFHESFGNALCRPDTTNSPFAPFIGLASVPLRDYVAQLRKQTLFMHRTLTNPALSYVTGAPLVVYRGLRLPRESHIWLRVSGVSSVTTDFGKACDFAFSQYGLFPDLYDARHHRSVIFRIELPAGSRLVPVSICSLQEEHELLLVHQGTLVVEESTRETLPMWNPFIDADGHRSEAGSLPYILIQATFTVAAEFPEYGAFRYL